MGGFGLFGSTKIEKLKINAGLYYNHEFFGNQFLPLAGLDWMATGGQHVYGLLPRTMNPEYKINDKLHVGTSLLILLKKFIARLSFI